MIVVDLAHTVIQEMIIQSVSCGWLVWSAFPPPGSLGGSTSTCVMQKVEEKKHRKSLVSESCHLNQEPVF